MYMHVQIPAHTCAYLHVPTLTYICTHRHTRACIHACIHTMFTMIEVSINHDNGPDIADGESSGGLGPDYTDSI